MAMLRRATAGVVRCRVLLAGIAAVFARFLTSRFASRSRRPTLVSLGSLPIEPPVTFCRGLRRWSVLHSSLPPPLQ
jgi:hypothetical protein